jgi:glycosyltransferase involved in cell wall biosynthesis
MRIAVSGYIGPKKTGIGVVAEGFLSQLVMNNPEGHEYYVFCNADSELVLPPDEHLHLVRYNVSRTSSIKNLLWTTLVYPMKCREIEAQLSIIPNVTCLVFKACPTIAIIHDLIEFKVPQKFGRARMLYRHIAVSLTAHRADFIVSASISSRNDIMQVFGISLGKITVIYSGIRNLNDSGSGTEPCKYNIPGDYLLYVGTIDHPGKNGIALVKAYSKLPEDLKRQLHIVFAGKPGPGFQYIEQEIETRGLKDRVIFLGFVPDAALPDLYAKCKVFMFPSRYEGFGLPVIEAMSYGAPVITARNSSLIEAAGDAGLLFDADDIEGMARAIEHLCRDSAYRETLIARGREHIKQFSWETNCQQWKEVINACTTVGKP